MRGRHPDRRWRLTAIGLALCLLSAVFAIEAKVAWFSPAGSPSAQISAAKLLPADSARHIAQALAPDASHHVPAELPLLLMFAAVVTAAPIVRGSLRQRVKVYASFGFVPSQYRRPPPQF